MYGTVVRLKVQEGKAGQLADLMREYEVLEVPGMVTTHLYQGDEDPSECWVAVAFDSRESYVANAESPEQHARFEKMRGLLESDPEWHDGAIVNSLS